MRVLLAAFSCVVAYACTGQPTPLTQPLAPQAILPSSLHVALLDADLPALAETVRLAAGKSLQIQAPAWQLPSAPTTTLAPFAWPLTVTQTTLAWQTPTRLRLRMQLAETTGDLSVDLQGQAACAVKWHAHGGLALLDVEIVRPAEGGIAIQPILPSDLKNPSDVTWQNPQLVDVGACLTIQPAEVAVTVAKHVQVELAAQLRQKLGDALIPQLQTIFFAGLEQSGRLPVAVGNPPIEARFSVAYHPQDNLVVAHAGALGQAHLDVGLEVDRDPCAVDVPMPQANSSPLAQPPPPPGQAFLRRALVLDAALVQRLAWMAARAGTLCRTAPANFGTALTPGWAADVLPQLDEWIEGAPASARFWPRSSPTTQLIDTPGGPGVEWTVEDAQLEIIARIADTELVVLTMTGSFRATLLPHLQGTSLLGFELATVERLSTHQSSPLLGDLAVPSEAALSALCESVLQGIFAGRAVLPLVGLSPGPLPPGTVLTRVDHSGDALWLWLEGGQPL